MAEVQELMTRLETARNRAEEMEREKSRLTGELEATKKHLTELETKCSEEFDCKITDLPAFIKQLKEEAEKSVASAEGVLGLRDDLPEVAPTPTPEPAKDSDGADAITDSGDEDGLL